MNPPSRGPLARLTKKRLLAGLVGGLVALVAPSGIKYALYERPAAAPRLRSLRGTEVRVPPKVYRSRGTGMPLTGTLTDVGYRLNDRWGFFDLHVRVEGEKGGLSTGLSPGEARQVMAAGHADQSRAKAESTRERPPGPDAED